MVMAPMTRSRAIEGGLCNPLAATYYAQRASAGLIVSEATQVSPQGVGYIRTPGIHSPEQVESWQRVTDAVHEAGGVIFAQLWHVGRVSHPDFHGGELPVAPSALPVDGEVFTPSGPARIVVPRALETSEIPGIVDQFRQAAINAQKAGFDGVEVHGNVFLLDQFLRDGSNIREDEYGGSIENRARFPLEVTAAVAEVFGVDRVGYRIGPNIALHSMSDSNPKETFTYLARELDKLGVAYLHIIEPIAGPYATPLESRLTAHLRSVFTRTLIVCGGYDATSAQAVLVSGDADLVAFGVPFLANPDLPERFKQNAAHNEPDYATFYQSEPADEGRGYTSYPKLQQGGARS
ncbi:alkene reductase [Pectobacterium carotovorum subsp. carotovorum]|nr:alkene reductase [Pectobacterium carotovorum subsp. carotovorum]